MDRLAAALKPEVSSYVGKKQTFIVTLQSLSIYWSTMLTIFYLIQKQWQVGSRWVKIHVAERDWLEEEKTEIETGAKKRETKKQIGV